MKELRILLVYMLVFGHASLFGGTMVVVEGSYDDANVTSTVNSQLSDIATDLNQEAAVKLAGNQEKLTTGSASANASQVHSASLYSGYDSKYISIGFAPASVSTVSPWNSANLQKDADNGKDTTTGFVPAMWTIDLLVNGDLFLPVRGLMFQAKFGYFDSDDLFGTGLSAHAMLFGGGVRYKVMHNKAGTPMFSPRSLSVGIGVYSSQSTLGFTAEGGELNQTQTSADGIETVSKTKLHFEIENSSIILPLELVASAKTLYFVNIFGGMGCDLVFGESKISVSNDTDITVSQNGSVVEPQSGGEASLALRDSTTKAEPDIFRSKIIFGFGFQAGPARFEFPFALYPVDYGFSSSVVVGASF